MKNFKILLLVIITVISIVGCESKNKNTLEGVWQVQNRNITVQLIMNGNNYIFLENGKEIERGVFETSWQTSEDNTIIKFSTQFITVYYERYDPFTEEIKFEDEFRYAFTEEGKLSINKLGLFEKITMPESEITLTNNIFENNKNNPDMRRTVVYNGQVYSVDISLNNIRDMIFEGKFNDYAQIKGIKNGILKDNVLYWMDNNKFIGAYHLQGVQNAVLRTGDEIWLAYLISMNQFENENNWTKAVYTGPNIPFSDTSGWGWNQWDIYGKLFFRNGEAVVEITEIEISLYR